MSSLRRLAKTSHQIDDGQPDYSDEPDEAFSIGSTEGPYHVDRAPSLEDDPYMGLGDLIAGPDDEVIDNTADKASRSHSPEDADAPVGSGGIEDLYEHFKNNPGGLEIIDAEQRAKREAASGRQNTPIEDDEPAPDLDELGGDEGALDIEALDGAPESGPAAMQDPQLDSFNSVYNSIVGRLAASSEEHAEASDAQTNAAGGSFLSSMAASLGKMRSRSNALAQRMLMKKCQQFRDNLARVNMHHSSLVSALDGLENYIDASPKLNDLSKKISAHAVQHKISYEDALVEIADTYNPHNPELHRQLQEAFDRDPDLRHKYQEVKEAQQNYVKASEIANESFEMLAKNRLVDEGIVQDYAVAMKEKNRSLDRQQSLTEPSEDPQKGILKRTLESLNESLEKTMAAIDAFLKQITAKVFGRG